MNLEKGNLSRRGFCTLAGGAGRRGAAGLVCPASSWPPRRKARPRRRPPTIASSWASSASAARRAAACRSSASRAPSVQVGAVDLHPRLRRGRRPPPARHRGDAPARVQGLRGQHQGLPRPRQQQVARLPARRHARPLARPGGHRGPQGRQGRLLREAADADRRRGAGAQEGGQGHRPRPADRQPAAHRRTAACSAWRSSWSAPAASARSRPSSAASTATRRAARSRRRPSPRARLGPLARPDPEGALSQEGQASRTATTSSAGGTSTPAAR